METPAKLRKKSFTIVEQACHQVRGFRNLYQELDDKVFQDTKVVRANVHYPNNNSERINGETELEYRVFVRPLERLRILCYFMGRHYLVFYLVGGAVLTCL